jgi:hypothetical protein
MGPVSEIDDPTLGRFKRTRLVNGNADEYKGTRAFDGHDVEVTLLSDDKRDVTATLEQARLLYARLPAVMQRVRTFAADKYVKHYNDVWRTDDDEAMTSERFLEEFVLAQLMIDPTGDVTLWFDDDRDFFEGHFVEVRLNPAGEVVSSDLLG